MKKLLLFILILNCAYSQCLLLNEGFESGSYTPTWSVGSAPITWNVTTIAPASGSYALEGIGGNSTHLQGLVTTIPTATPSSISWWIKPNGTSANNYVVIGDASVAAANCISFCYWVGSAGQIRFISSSSYSYTAVTGQWYFIEMRNINYTARTFDIYINNTLQQTGFPFRSSTINTVERIHLYNFSPGVTASWDDIRIGNNPISLSAFTTNVNCNGGATGAIDLTATSINPGALTYNWSNSSITEDVTGLIADTFSVIVTDAAGCIDSLENIVLTEPTAIATSMSFTAPNCNSGSNGTATISATGGVPGYTYLWNNSATSDSISGISAGTYICTITDTNNCSISDTIVVTEPTAIAISVTPTNPTSCGGNEGNIMSNVTGGTPGYSYFWNTGDTTSMIDSLENDTYVLYVTDTLGCNDTVAVTLSDPTPTNITLSIPTDSICVTSPSIVLSGASLSGGSYSGVGVISGNFDPAVAGIGNAIITYTYTDTNNCVSSANDQISVIGCLGLEEDNVDVSIYPNPFTEIVHISASQEISSIELVNVQGKLISSHSVNTTNHIYHAGNLASGIYFIKVNMNEQTIITKLIKN